jgi:hypothetical protein
MEEWLNVTSRSEGLSDSADATLLVRTTRYTSEQLWTELYERLLLPVNDPAAVVARTAL